MAIQEQQASYASDGAVVITGPITGTVTLPDGAVYDVTKPVIEVHPDHAQAVADAIGDRYAEEGHPALADGATFVHEKAKSFGRAEAQGEEN
jgi:hypothetical protein